MQVMMVMMMMVMMVLMVLMMPLPLLLLPTPTPPLLPPHLQPQRNLRRHVSQLLLHQLIRCQW